MKNEREKEAGKERKTVVERARGQRRADDKATPPQQHGKRELMTGEPAAATEMKIWLMMKMMCIIKPTKHSTIKKKTREKQYLARYP